MLNKQISVKQLVYGVLVFVMLIAVVSCTDASQSSVAGQQTAIGKWGAPGTGITNFYEYQQMQQVYKLRDNPTLILNAYLFSEMTGQLTCFGKIKGFGVPYGTQQSPPSNGTQPVPEPNGLYPSTSTNADWVQYIQPDGSTTIGFVEPNMIITAAILPCKPLTQ